jgi:hypothetical protein
MSLLTPMQTELVPPLFDRGGIQTWPIQELVDPFYEHLVTSPWLI